jgi:four helix bundle protein
MQDFHQLNVWRKAHTLVLRVYTASKELPSSETMGLAAHLRRSAVTIPRSIAEGTGRSSDFEFTHDLRKSQAAAHELEYILLLCRDLGFIAEPTHDKLLEDVLEVRRMISGLVNRLTKAEQPAP